MNATPHVGSSLPSAPLPPQEEGRESPVSDDAVELVDRVHRPGDAQTAKVQNILAAVANAFTEPFGGPSSPGALGTAHNISRVVLNANGLAIVDENGNMVLERYWIPNLGLADYLSAVKVDRSLYCRTEAGLAWYAPSIGYFASVSLIVSREEAEDRYDEIIREVNCPKKETWSDVKPKWSTRIFRTLHPAEYAAERRRLNELRRSALEAAVVKWKATGLFRDVFIADDKYRMGHMGLYPECVSTHDKVVFAYKPLEPEKQTPGVIPQALPVYPTDRDQQLIASKHEHRNRPLLQKVWDRCKPFPRSYRVDVETLPPFPTDPPPPETQSWVCDRDSFFFLGGGGRKARLSNLLEVALRCLCLCMARLHKSLAL